MSHVTQNFITAINKHIIKIKIKLFIDNVEPKDPKKQEHHWKDTLKTEVP